MNIILSVITVLVTFGSMEFVAWFTHKFIMHGFLWILHKDHHKPDHDKLEKNDLFALIFALPSTALLISGSISRISFEFWIGLGIALYGLAYFLFHDVLIHERVKVFRGDKNKYFRAIITAHNDHHVGKKNYGFLFMVPWRYFRQEFFK